MLDLPQTRSITIKSIVDEINKSIEDRNYVSVLTMSLMIPDICSNYVGWINKDGKGYKNWYDKYVYAYKEVPIVQLKKKYGKNIPKTYDIKFNGKACYSLRCSIFHEGTTPFEFKYLKQEKMKRIKTIELSVNSESDKDLQYGEAKKIERYGNMEQQVIRLNIVNFAKDIIDGCNRFLKENNIDDIRLFNMIDWDKKGNIIFTPHE